MTPFSLTEESVTHIVNEIANTTVVNEITNVTNVTEVTNVTNVTEINDYTNQTIFDTSTFYKESNTIVERNLDLSTYNISKGFAYAMCFTPGYNASYAFPTMSYIKRYSSTNSTSVSANSTACDQNNFPATDWTTATAYSLQNCR